MLITSCLEEMAFIQPKMLKNKNLPEILKMKWCLQVPFWKMLESAL